ncbi:MAG: transposase [Nocardioidaceae bacterium]|nr:transposase [Nocardioidaceae bacterium]
MDEHTRESLADVVAYSIDADTTVDVLDKIAADRGRYPRFIRCDNGPELTANALKDWCRFNRAGTAYIEPGSPWQNPWVESYGSRMRDELLTQEVFDTLLQAQVLVADWRDEYNHTTDPTPPSACSHPTSTPADGRPTHQNSHNEWTTSRGPVTCVHRARTAVCEL